MTRRPPPLPLLVALLATASLAAAAPPSRTLPDLPPDLRVRAERIWSGASPAAKSWAAQQASAVARGPGDPGAMARAAAAGSAWAVRGTVAGADVEALVFLVLMEAARSAQEDLKAVMKQVQAGNEARERTRAALGRVHRDLAANAGKAPSSPCVPPRCGLSKAEIDVLHRPAGPGARPAASLRVADSLAGLKSLEEGLTSDLDSMSELGETESLRLQMAMDRLSKMMSTLSNLLKKISDTAASITQNLK